jgi:soluble lytic murein transglycosylase-like protein
MRRPILCLLLLASFPAFAAEKFYMVIDEDGNQIITDTPETGAIPFNIRDTPNIDLNLDFTEQESKYDYLILQYSRLYRVDPFLVKAVIRTESMFDPRAESDAGASGLMQLMPATAERFRVDDRLDPEQSIRAGTEYLRWLLDLFKGDSTLAVASYNCGERLVQRLKKVPSIPETQDYVVKVEAARRQYKLKGLNGSTIR